MTVSTTKPWSIYATLLFGSFIAVEAAAFQSPALPAIAAYFGVQENLAALIALLYYLGVASFGPLFGRVADSFGRKKVMTRGLLLFSLSEFIAALAPSFSVLLAARLFQGIATAAIVPILLSYVAYLFPREKRGMPLGVFSFTMAVGGASGAVIGGLLIDLMGWRSIYWVSGFAGLLGFLLVTWRTPETPIGDNPFRLDIWGTFWMLIGVGALISLPTWISHAGFLSLATLATLSVAILGTFALWQTEKRALSPVLDIEILTRKAFILPCLIYLLFLVCHNGCVYTMAFFINNRPGGNASQIGLINTFIFCSGMAAGLISGKLVDIFSERTVIIGVVCIAITGLCFFATIDTDTSLWTIILIMSILGFTQGLKGPAVTKLALSTLPPQRYGSGSGMFSMMRDLGSPAGISIGLALFTSQRISATEDAVTEKAQEMGLEANLLPQAQLAIEQGGLTGFPELAARLQQLGIDFETLSAAAKIEGLSGALPSVGLMLMTAMVIALILAFRLPKAELAKTMLGTAEVE